jgi:predicted P-loop ATPase
MTPTGTPEIADVLRQLGREAILREAEAAGLRPRNGRMRCAFQGCRDKPQETRSDSAWIYPGPRNVPRIHCARCGGNGSLVDLVAAVNRWTDAQAIAHLRGLEAPAPRPALRVVAPQPPPADKLPPEEVRRIWQQLAPDDAEGRAYLEGRGLGEAVTLGLVRFATADHPNERIRYWHRDRRRVVALMRDVVGAERGIQGRLCRAPKPGEKKKCIGLKDTWNKRAFFGAPELIEAAPVIAVAEGLPDYLALAIWSNGRNVIPVAAAGMDGLASLAEELQRVGVSVEGRVFALFPQNDRPRNKSRAAFDRLAQLLHAAGARVVMWSVPDEYKDLADWLQAHPDEAWPPASVAAALGGEAAEEHPDEQLVEPVRGGLPVPARVTVAAYGQNLSTLVALLDDPVHREGIMGRRGELALNEMTGELDFCGQELDETDITGIRLGLEQRQTPDGKRLKFAPQEVWDALAYLSKRKMVHPVRDWLRSLRWAQEDLLGEPLARAFGLEWPSLEHHLFRKWFVGAVARPISPGCKMDTVLILMGLEGKRKSTFFEELAGERWFTASPVHIGEADGYQVLRYNWIIEWAELDSMRRARDQQSLKAFISERHNFYRAKWAKGHTRVARGCVMVGTTNEERPLQEAQGNRRFWPIRVPKVDHRWLRTNREQLWAQAVAIYDAAANCPDCAPLLPKERCEEHRWWLEEEMALHLRQHNLEFQEADEWVEVIRAWLAKEQPKAITIAKVLLEAIQKPAGQWTRREDNRVADALRTLGWAPTKVRRYGGEVGRFWVPPAQLELGEREPGSDG